MIYICIIIGYVFGGFLTAVLVSKAHGKDYRKIDPTMENMGNPGAMNITLNISLKAGLLVLLGDVMKVILAFGLSWYLYKDYSVIIYTGLGCILGHDFSYMTRFNGGKGVAVTLVWLIFLFPKHCWLIFLLLFILVCITGYLNLASILLPAMAIPFAFILYNSLTGYIMIFVSIITLYRNRIDIKKILDGSYERTYPKDILIKKKEK